MLDSIQKAYIGGTIVANSINIGISVLVATLLTRITVPHTNLRTLAVFWVIGYLAQNTGQIVFMTTLLINQTVVLSSEFSVATASRYFIFFGIFLTRLLLIFTSIERLIATIWLGAYEKKQRITLFLIIFGLSLLFLTVVLTVIYFLTKDISTAYITMLLSLDATGIFLFLLVHFWNIRLDKKRQSTSMSLSERYQIGENLRILRIQLPVILIAHGLSMFSVITTTFIQLGLSFTEYRVVIFHCANALVLTVYFCIFTVIQKVYIYRLLQKFSFVRRLIILFDLDVTKSNLELQNLTVTTKDLHFRILNEAWKK